MIDSKNYVALHRLYLGFIELQVGKNLMKPFICQIYHRAIKTYTDIDFAHLYFYIPINLNRTLFDSTKSIFDEALEAKNSSLIQFLLNAGALRLTHIKLIPENLLSHIDWCVEQRNYREIKAIYDILVTKFPKHIDASDLMDEIYSRAVKIYNGDEFKELSTLLPLDINKQVRYTHIYPTRDLYSEHLHASLLYLAVREDNYRLINYLIEQGVDTRECNKGGSIAELVTTKIKYKNISLQNINPHYQSDNEEARINAIQATLNCLEKFCPSISEEQLSFTHRLFIPAKGYASKRLPVPVDVYSPTCTLF